MGCYTRTIVAVISAAMTNSFIDILADIAYKDNTKNLMPEGMT